MVSRGERGEGRVLDKTYVQFRLDHAIIGQLFFMGGTDAQLIVGRHGSLPGHLSPTAPWSTRRHR
jgi:hypothetical protein